MMGASESEKRRKRALRRAKALEAQTSNRKWVVLSWEDDSPMSVDLGFCDALEAAQRAGVFSQVVYERAIMDAIGGGEE